MKNTGIIRKIDELGRVVLPVEIRRALTLNIKDPVEIYTDKDSIILKKYSCSCIFCDEKEDLIEFHGKHVCPACLKKVKSL